MGKKRIALILVAVLLVVVYFIAKYASISYVKKSFEEMPGVAYSDVDQDSGVLKYRNVYLEYQGVTYNADTIEIFDITPFSFNLAVNDLYAGFYNIDYINITGISPWKFKNKFDITKLGIKNITMESMGKSVFADLSGKGLTLNISDKRYPDIPFKIKVKDLHLADKENTTTEMQNLILQELTVMFASENILSLKSLSINNINDKYFDLVLDELNTDVISFNKLEFERINIKGLYDYMFNIISSVMYPDTIPVFNKDMLSAVYLIKFTDLNFNLGDIKIDFPGKNEIYNYYPEKKDYITEPFNFNITCTKCETREPDPLAVLKQKKLLKGSIVLENKYGTPYKDDYLGSMVINIDSLFDFTYILDSRIYDRNEDVEFFIKHFTVKFKNKGIQKDIFKKGIGDISQIITCNDDNCRNLVKSGQKLINNFDSFIIRLDVNRSFQKYQEKIANKDLSGIKLTITVNNENPVNIVF